jgi:hypothetical protein
VVENPGRGWLNVSGVVEQPQHAQKAKNAVRLGICPSGVPRAGSEGPAHECVLLIWLHLNDSAQPRASGV